MTNPRVLVTGGSGFLAAHCILRLLEGGFPVRTTVRSERGADRVRSMVAAGGSTAAADVEVVQADLTADDGWDAAVAGCDHVLHVASPFPAAPPAHEDDLIVPARDGALRVLRAARRGDVERVVLTSSLAAIDYGHPPMTTPYDERTWTDLTGPGVTAYAKSKTLAERAAWDFSEREGLELTVVNPTGILGPVLSSDYGTSVGAIALLLEGGTPVLPRATVGIVDARDVADLHVRAMTHPAAAGERFVATAGLMTLPDMARTLRDGLGDAARKVPTRTIPDWVVRIVALFDVKLRLSLSMLGTPRDATSAKAQRVLGWAPRSPEEAVLATARSILALTARGS
ncbi:NAD-dependent epimerase/dehydratase family protein [Pseudonocardia cypriaca]|uniref:Dihydroflavonol-4-reductase n=1 Tax=Pseudonocardia cypriaca TaxID=882449 RepID=A0A543GCT5_9PSEU|nr:NAD-dependent epimerase/dehydratase family protein [Pseudonocardia cypriaca]TQM43868.1 dihydroflavonol-4-reductase [Pseudonocardia cypriaca]